MCTKESEALKGALDLCSANGVCPCSCNYATDSGCQCRDIKQAINVTLTKSAVYATYPLTYVKAFNYQPYEVTNSRTCNNIPKHICGRFQKPTAFRHLGRLPHHHGDLARMCSHSFSTIAKPPLAFCLSRSSPHVATFVDTAMLQHVPPARPSQTAGTAAQRAVNSGTQHVRAWERWSQKKDRGQTVATNAVPQLPLPANQPQDVVCKGKGGTGDWISHKSTVHFLGRQKELHLDARAV